QDVDDAGLAVAEQNLVTWAERHVARLLEALGKHLNSEPVGHVQLRAFRLGNHAGAVGGRRCRKRRRQLDFGGPAGGGYEQEQRAVFHTVLVYYANGHTRSMVRLVIQLLSSSFRNFI